MDATYIPILTAAVAAGVDERTIRRWIAAGWVGAKWDEHTGQRVVNGVAVVDLTAYAEMRGKQRVTAELVQAWKGKD